MPGTVVVHTAGHELEVFAADRLLFVYRYAGEEPQIESPRPYFHPLCTLAGESVTDFRPADHAWHHGLSMTCAELSGENFWGGPTWVTGHGYAQLENNGRVDHEGWQEGSQLGGSREGTSPLEERLAWTTQAGERWLEERRRIAVDEIDAEGGHWTLGLGFELRNVSGRALELGSPTTAGRPDAGYGGLFWRGPASFLGGRILAGGALEGPEVMGKRSPWLAFTGRHDGSGRTSTLVFVDDPRNPRYPTTWFVRNEPYACASFAFMFHEPYPLAAGEELVLRYRLIVADGAWPRARIESAVAGHPA